MLKFRNKCLLICFLGSVFNRVEQSKYCWWVNSKMISLVAMGSVTIASGSECGTPFVTPGQMSAGVINDGMWI